MKIAIAIDIDLAAKLYLLLKKSDPFGVHEQACLADLRKQIDEQARMVEAMSATPEKGKP